MRAVVQRATRAQVSVDDHVVAAFDGPGLVALVGVTHTDDAAAAATMARKIVDLRILEGEVSATDIGAPVLVVSQFTLYADASKGRRPSWSAAAPRQVAEPLVDEVVARIRERGVPVQTGTFGEHMRVCLVNDGPVTIILETGR